MNIIEQAQAPRSRWRGFGIWLLVLALLAIIVFGIIYIRVQTTYDDQIVSINDILATHQTAIVYGAGLKAKGIPGDVLEDRVLTALDVYQAGTVEQIVMSGTLVENHDEVQAMVNLAVQEGLSEGVLIKDYTGDSTFETCENIALQYPENGVVLITQGFHLKRALYICNKMGLDAVGVDAGRRTYPKQFQYTLREIPASILDWFEVLVYNIRTR
jgi:vancomycin permeability regulator SanA